jgi:hypothetical protein
VYLEDINLQLIALGAVFAISLLKPGWRIALQNLKMLSPFVAMLIVVYALFILMGISPQGTMAYDYWLSYGVPRILLLVSSVLFFRICFSIVSLDDLIRSHISIRYLKYLILGKILYDAAFHSFDKIRFWQNISPSMKKAPKGFKERFKRSLAATLALVLYTLSEAEQKGQKIDDLILHCHKERS